jgi:hypothetical protein
MPDGIAIAAMLVGIVSYDLAYLFAVSVIIAMMHLSIRTRIMSGFTLPPALCILGWVATGVMASTVVAMGVTWVR